MEEAVPYRGFSIKLFGIQNKWSAYDQDGVQLCQEMYCRDICLEAAQRLIDGRIGFHLNQAKQSMPHNVIAIEVEELTSINPTKEGVWFETRSPGPLPPGLIFLSWEHLETLLRAKPIT